jgi:hypothetical protein
MEVEASDILPFLGALISVLETTHIGHYQNFRPSHPHHLERGVVHNLISRAKVISQDQKDLNKDIKKIRHDLMLNEYRQEYVDSIMKQSFFRYNIPEHGHYPLS